MEENLNLFCKELDTRYLVDIDRDVLDMMIARSIPLLHNRKGNRKLMKILFNHLNLNDMGNPKKLRDDKAEDIVQKFLVSATGARPGDVITGSTNKTKGAVIIIRGGEVYPESGYIDIVKKDKTQWNHLLDKLSSLPLFKEKDKKAIVEWLEIQSDYYHHDNMGESGNVVFEVIQPGNLALDIGEKNAEKLISGNPKRSDGYWDVDSILDMFPKKTLAFFRSFWSLGSKYQIDPTFSGTQINIWDKNGTYFVLKDIAKSYKKKGTKYLIDQVQEIGVSMDTRSVKKIRNSDLLQNHLQNLPPSAYKSLIQKIVRFRPRKIQFIDGTEIDSETVLRTLVRNLILLPGAFVPDIQRYVTGKESAFKRVGVCVIEDSCGSLEDVSSCFAAALLAQRVPMWKPDEQTIVNCQDTIVKAWKTAKYWDYSIKKASKKPFVLKNGQSLGERQSCLLDELKSFETDLLLSRNIGEGAKIVNGFVERPTTMPIEHCVDQHWAPNVILFLPQDFIDSFPIKNNSTPFQPVISWMWSFGSFNPRKTKISIMKDLSNIKLLRKAQKLSLISYKLSPKKRRNTSKKIRIPFEIHGGWISSLVGTIELKTSPPRVATLNPLDLNEIIIVRKPSRSSANLPPLSQRQIDLGRLEVREILAHGYPLKAATAPVEDLVKAKLYLVENEFVIKKAGKSDLKWKDLNGKMKIDYPLHTPIPVVFENAFEYTGTGLSSSFDTDLSDLLSNTSKASLQRALSFLSGFSPIIEMNRISRDGGGTILSVTKDDPGCYHFLSGLCVIFPGALQPIQGPPGRFSVKSGPLLWWVRSKIEKSIRTRRVVSKGWDLVNDKRGRILKPYQKTALGELQVRKERGYHGSFIWMTVGGGKTLVVMSYLKWLMEKQELPDYVVYTVPKSALETIIAEVNMFGFKTNLLVPTKGKFVAPKGLTNVERGCTSRPFHINLITSDSHMRLCESGLVNIAGSSLIIFDEVHKNMNDTKRTSVAIDLARLSKNFIAMTGTPVIDSHAYKLVAWLKMIVPFEVNVRNYLVAGNAMVTKLIDTGIPTEHISHNVTMAASPLAKYRKLVPLGLGGTNQNPQSHQLREALDICYEECSRKMIEACVDLIKKSHKILLVVRDNHHQTVMKTRLSQKISPKRIFCLTGKEGIHLDASVVGTSKDYLVVIVPIRRAEGYTVTSLDTMISSVYPSNLATRTQMEGRINRVGQKAKKLTYHTFHTGILTRWLETNMEAKSIEQALAKI